MLLLFCYAGLLWSLCHTDIDLFSFWLIDIRIHERPIDFPAVFIRNTPAVNRAAIAGFSDNLLLIRIGDIFRVSVLHVFRLGWCFNDRFLGHNVVGQAVQACSINIHDTYKIGSAGRRRLYGRCDIDR